MEWTRRELLRASAASAALGAPWLTACANLAGGAAEAPTPFAHGVASGDPQADRVILWTRVSPPGHRLTDPTPVAWRVARDAALEDVVVQGRTQAALERDHTVKVDAEGLEPGRTYYYRFECAYGVSPIGRTRTLPEAGVDRVRLAFASCANFPQGYFNAYRSMARRRDLDAVVHLGDYLYEYADGVYGSGADLGRFPEPLGEIVSLADYRMRYAQYRRDADLQELHRQHPMIAVWDDHELANNAWSGGAENHHESQGLWLARRAAAVRAYREWMPIRDRAPRHVDTIYRSFRFGDLAELLMLDTRLVGRHEQGARDLRAARDKQRELLGVEQASWLHERLRASQSDGVTWRVLGQQVVMSPLALPDAAGNPDSWDGYRAARTRLFDQLERGRIDDVVVLTGDIHSSWALDVARDPFDSRRYDPETGRGGLAVEFVAPAIASSPLGSFEQARELFANAGDTHPHLRFLEMQHRGYGVLDLDRDRAQAEWYFVDTVAERGGVERFAAAFATPRGRSRLEPVDAPAPPAAAAELAP